jgi:secretion/DNA translocation related TadE-like protein
MRVQPRIAGRLPWGTSQHLFSLCFSPSRISANAARPGRTGAEAELGAGTVLALGLVLVLLTLLAGVLFVAQAAIGASRAAAAADLAALAGADAARGLTEGDPCTVAADVVHQHGAELTGCVVSGEGTIVQVDALLLLPGPLEPAVGRARAGPPP